MTCTCRIENLELSRRGGFRLSIPRLELGDSSIYALTGPNGAGKSTLLHTMALIDIPSTGSIYLEDQPVSNDRGNLYQFRKHITLVEQAPYLFNRTVEQNLELGLKIRGVRKNERRRRIESALASVDMQGFAKRNARELSGGEAQRVALARALVLKPKLLLLDEPSANIDQSRLEALGPLLQNIARQGCTIVFSTHEELLPRRLGAQVIRIENGCLSQRPLEEGMYESASSMKVQSNG